LLSQAADPAIRALDPELAVSAAYPKSHVYFSDFAEGHVAPGHLDPWGSPWRWRKVETAAEGNWYVGDVTPEYFAFYSAGPNGQDERLGGDDVQLHFFPATPFVVWLEEAFLILAMLALWFARGPFAASPRGPSVLVEALKGLVLVSLPLVISLLVLDFALRHPWAVSLQKTQRLVVPAPVAWFGSVVVLWLLAGLGLRLTQPAAVPDVSGGPRSPEPPLDLQGQGTTMEA
jgi:hypothetical protein